MARDKNLQERIESIIYGFYGGGPSGLAAEAIVNAVVEHLKSGFQDDQGEVPEFKTTRKEP